MFRQFQSLLIRIFQMMMLVTCTPLAASAGLTQAEITSGLGAPAVQTWTLVTPASAVWTASGAGLQLSSAATGEVSAIEATFNGPGMASLNVSHDYGIYEISVWVDGVLSGSKSISDTTVERVQIAAGSHKVRWQAERAPSSSNYPWLILRKAVWESFTEQPLPVGATGAGIVLTSPGAQPWIGQNTWHHGDGGGAWSGLSLNTPIGQVVELSPLHATFEGPGLLDFRYLAKGGGGSSFRLDAGPPQYVYAYVSSPEDWKKRFMRVGVGTHIMEWQPLPNSGYTRTSYDLTVDEIQLRPEIPLADALDTPGWNWSVVADSGDPLATGVADATASGGSMAVIAPGSAIVATVSGGQLLKIRWRGAAPRLLFDTWLTPSTPVTNANPTAWIESSWFLAAGERNLEIYGDWNLEIDRIEFVPPPATLAATLGLADGSFSMGGGDSWTIVPYPEIVGHGARIAVPKGRGDSWLEMPVQGPAAIDFSWKSDNYNVGFSVRMDGNDIDLMNPYGHSSQVRIEIPAGPHVIHWHARAPGSSDSWQTFTGVLGGIQVTPLPPGGRAMAALDSQVPFSVPADWPVSTAISRNGQPTLTGPPAATSTQNYGDSNQIKANFTGPGDLSFWWYAGIPATGSNVARWDLRNAASGSDLLDRSQDAGWKKEKIWLPPGASLIEWEVSGSVEEIALTALDGIQFTPSPTVALGKALGAPELAWTNDPLRPWTGINLTNPVGDLAISPVLMKGESSRFSTVVHGPGKVSFQWKNLQFNEISGQFLINGTLWNSSSGTGRVEVEIPVSSQVSLEWIATAAAWADSRNGVIGVENVIWTPTPALPLAGSLDAPGTVVWKTSVEIPFTGHADSGAKGASSAYVGLQPGESSWLEAVVDGPGLFDFWLRKEANMDLPGYLWSFWSLTIDSNPVAIDGTSWPAQWITGAGTHRIRLTLRNTTSGYGSQWIASGVDDVNWIPFQSTSLTIAGGLPGKTWLTGKAQPAEGLATWGRRGIPAILLRPGQGKPSWVGIKVKGPCELSWDSSLDDVNWRIGSVQSLRVDGVNVMPVPSHSWQRMRLTLPKGIHSVRWVSAPGSFDSDQTQPPVAYTAWRLSGMKIKLGISPLAQAVDLATLYALEAGDTGGHLVAEGKDDAWEPGLLSSLFFFDPHRAGRLSAVWGRPDSAGQQWDYEQSGSVYPLYGDSAGWHQHVAAIAPGSFVKWSYPLQDWWQPARKPPTLKQVKFSGSVAKEPAFAIGSPQPLASGAWLALADPKAVDGLDSAWSLLNDSATSHPASLTLTGPSTVSFWWKSKGPGSLRLYLDGAYLPVATPGSAWTKVQFAINPGDHVIEWLHSPAAGNSFSKPAEARLDGLKIVNVTSSSLTQAAALDPRLELTTTIDVPGQLSWHPVVYQEANGSWTRAARAVSGSRVLRTTVTGPAVLEFRGRCFEGFPSASQAGLRQSVVVIGGGTPQILGHFLAVNVGGTGMLRISSNAAGTWQNGAVHVPAGTHEVTFRLMTLQSALWGESIIDATIPDLQGWVDDLRLVSPASHFQAWAIANKLPPDLAGQDADADGDGASNFLEYSFGTSPLDSASRPLALTFGVASRGFDLRQPELRIPYLPSHASGILQSSADLVHWQTEPTPMLHDRPLTSVLANSQSTSTYQALPIPMDAPQKFYRVWISDSPPAE